MSEYPVLTEDRRGMSIPETRRRRTKRISWRGEIVRRAPPAAYRHRFYDGKSGEYGTFLRARSLLWNWQLLRHVRILCTIGTDPTEASAAGFEGEEISVPEETVENYEYNDESTRGRWKHWEQDVQIVWERYKKKINWWERERVARWREEQK